MAALALPAAAMTAAAQDAAADAKHIGKVVVTASRTTQDIAEVPASIQILEAADIAALPGSTVDEKLASVSGANTIRANGIYSFSAVVSLRGMAGDQGRTLVLLDGIPVNTSATGSVNWNRLNIEDIERIEVYKGAASSIYGSNAAGGVINIITAKPLKTGASADASYGTYNTYSAKATGGLKTGKFYTQASAYYVKSDGYNSTPDSLRTTGSTARNVREKDAGIKAGYQLTDNQSLEAAYSYYDGLRGEGTQIRAEDGVSRRFRTQFTRLAWTGKADKVEWQSNLFYQKERYGRTTESLTGTTYARTDTDGDRIDKGIQGSLTADLYGLKMTPGFDYKAGTVDAVDTNMITLAQANNRGKIYTYAPYLQAQKDLVDGRLKLLGALRYDRAEFRDGYVYNPSNPAITNGTLAEQSWDRVTPKVSVGWVYSDKAEQYVSYGQAFRAPNLEDMCLNLKRGTKMQIANPDLKPETINTLETGFRLNPLKGFSIEPAAYYTRARDFIYYTDTGARVTGTTTPIYKYQNVSRAEIYGGELDMRYQLPYGLALNGSYAYTHSEVLSFPQNAAAEGKRLTNDPVNMAYASLSWENPDIVNASFAWRYKDGQYTNDTNTATINAYSTIGAKVWRSFPYGVTASLAVDNILDERYLESETDQAPGRTITAALNVKF